MPNCEICGTNVTELIESKISGAKLSVCPDCTSHGTRIETDESNTESTSKYSTSSTNSQSTNSTTQSSQTSSTDSSYGKSTPDILMLNYGESIMQARSETGLSRTQFASKLNIKESHLRNIENETMQPDEKLQSRIESYLGIDLSSDDFDGG